jgi:tetratricopeptide (TPR) repeat protein
MPRHDDRTDRTVPSPWRVPARLLLVLALLAPAAGCSQYAAYLLGNCRNARDADGAIAACTRAIDSGGLGSRDLATAYSLRGSARSFRKDPGAMQDMDAAVRLAPDDAEFLALRGGVLAEQGKFDAAGRDLDEALRLEPNNLIALGNRTVLLEHSGRYKEVRAVADTLIQVAPDDYRGWAQRCWAGAVLADELEQSLSDCDRAIEMEARDPNNFNSRGLVNYRLGRYAQAVADYDRSLQGDPGVASSYLMRGLARRALGAAGSDDDLAKSRQMDPGVAARYASYGVDTGAPPAPR